MNSNNVIKQPTICLDLDGIMTTSKQYFGRYHKEYNGHSFDPKCVKVLNSIIELCNPIIILSSDWKLHFTIPQLNKIFEINKVNAIVTDITPSLWGNKEARFNNLAQLEECRAAEILQYVNEHEITNWVAVDDLNLKPWIANNFVWCTRSNEGLKQCGIKEKIIKSLKHK